MKAMDSLVSVIITTYCRPVQMLMRALSSARNQTYENLEIIVVDDSPATFAQREAVQEAIQSLQDNRVVYLRPLRQPVRLPPPLTQGRLGRSRAIES